MEPNFTLEKLAKALNTSERAVRSAYARGYLPAVDAYDPKTSAPLWGEAKVAVAKASQKLQDHLALEQGRAPSFIDQIGGGQT